MTTEEKEQKPKKFPLTRDEAFQRVRQVIDKKTKNYTVDYNLILTLRKSTDLNDKFKDMNFEGRLELLFTYVDPKQEDIFLNFVGVVSSVTINGKQTPVNYQNCKVILNHSDLICNSLNKVVILYSAKYDKSGSGMHHFIDPIDKNEYIYTQFEPYDCNLVFPVFDQPSIKGRLSLCLVGPQDWTMLSNEKELCRWKITKDTRSFDKDLPYIQERLGNLTDEEYAHLFECIYDKNYFITIFDKTPRIAPYLTAMCAGPYYCYTNPYQYEVPLRVFMRQSLKNNGEPKEFFRVTMAGMEWYKRFFGIAYPFTKYDQIFCPEFNFGAMENVGLVTYNEHYCWKSTPTQINRARFCITTLHELAHMWFGNLVTMTWWDDLWLNESFATFISFLCQSQAVKEEYPNTWIAFNNMKGFAYREDQKDTTHPIMADIIDTEKSDSHFDSIVYYKGSSFLKQMFYFIGEENFSNGLKEYFKAYKWGNTTFDDFVGKMVEQINKETNTYNSEFKFDLKSLCRKWLNEAGLNELSCEYESEGDKIKSFTINQTPVLSKFPNMQNHLFNIKFIYDDPNENIEKKVMITPQEKTVIKTFEGLKVPKGIILNYGDWAFFKWKVDLNTIEYLKTDLIKKLPDTLSRQMFYRALFDMTRDAILPCQDYLDIVSDFLKQESSEDIITNVLRNVNGVVKTYLPLEMYPTYADKLFDLVSAILAKNLNNNEIIKLLVEFLPQFANKNENIKILKKWLDTDEGIVIVDNKEIKFPIKLVGQAIRFAICTLVYSLEEFTLEEKEKVLNKEIERDRNSDESTRAKCRCKAALPDLKIKEEIWNKIINEPLSDSLYNMKAYMSGLIMINQIKLVENLLTEKFFEGILKLETCEYFYVENFFAFCSPIYFPNEEVIKKTEEVAGKVKLDVLKKGLLDLVDDLKRVKKAQDLAKAKK